MADKEPQAAMATCRMCVNCQCGDDCKCIDNCRGNCCGAFTCKGCEGERSPCEGDCQCKDGCCICCQPCRVEECRGKEYSNCCDSKCVGKCCCPCISVGCQGDSCGCGDSCKCTKKGRDCCK